MPKKGMLVNSVTKVGFIAAVILLTGCPQQQLDQFNKDIASFNQAMAGGVPTASRPAVITAGLARTTDTGKRAQTQLVVPAGKTAGAALGAALPNIK